MVSYQDVRLYIKGAFTTLFLGDYNRKGLRANLVDGVAASHWRGTDLASAKADPVSVTHLRSCWSCRSQDM